MDIGVLAVEHIGGPSDVPPAPTADDLLARVASGDVEAFAAFYDLVAAQIFAFVRSIVRDPARSEEVVQEVMLELWRIAPSFDPRCGTAKGWAFSIARCRAVDCVRSESSRRRRDRRHFEDCVLATQCEQPEPCNVALRVDIGSRVRQELASLPEAQRVPIELAYFDGLSHTQIAAALRLPLGTVKSRVRSGLRQLRHELEGRPID